MVLPGDIDSTHDSVLLGIHRTKNYMKKYLTPVFFDITNLLVPYIVLSSVFTEEDIEYFNNHNFKYLCVNEFDELSLYTIEYQWEFFIFPLKGLFKSQWYEWISLMGNIVTKYTPNNKKYIFRMERVKFALTIGNSKNNDNLADEYVFHSCKICWENGTFLSRLLEFFINEDITVIDIYERCKFYYNYTIHNNLQYLYDYMTPLFMDEIEIIDQDLLSRYDDFNNFCTICHRDFIVTFAYQEGYRNMEISMTQGINMCTFTKPQIYLDALSCKRRLEYPDTITEWLNCKKPKPTVEKLRMLALRALNNTFE